MDNQCEETGLTTNWFSIEGSSSTDLTEGGYISCSGSGTPADEFGSEASRGVWRVALDYMFYPEESVQVDGSYGSYEYSKRVVEEVIPKMMQLNLDESSADYCAWSSCVDDLTIDSDCFVGSIHSGWVDNMFMFGPVASSLIVPSSSDDHQEAINNASELISSKGIDSYYSGSWVALTSMLFDQDLMTTVKTVIEDKIK